MRVLIAGSGGMLAADLAPRLAVRGQEVVRPPESELDITDPRAIARWLDEVEPAVLYNCAAYNFVDRAESEPERAEAINGTAVRDLALACRQRGVVLVHFSTDYVFDGGKRTPYRVDDPPNPVNRYGRSKWMGESFVRELAPRGFVIRTSWLYGVHGKNFVETILRLARERGELRVIDTETGCPTWTGHLADAAIDLAASGRYGTYHASNSGPTTWYDFAAEILRCAGVDVPLHRASAADLGRPARRPVYSVLDPHPLPEVIGREMPPWRTALAEYFEVRKSVGPPPGDRDR